VTPFDDILEKLDEILVRLTAVATSALPIVGITNKMDDLILVCEQIRDHQSDHVEF